MVDKYYLEDCYEKIFISNSSNKNDEMSFDFNEVADFLDLSSSELLE